MNVNSDLISTTDRRAQIISALEEKGVVQVQELSELYRVSQVTIRNDLAYLEGKNVLLRTRGGAIKHNKIALDLAISEKARRNFEQKRRIGKKAAELIHDGDTIIIDSGTTTLEIAKRINNFSHLTVITHALNIALELAKVENIEIIMPGGTLRSNSFSLVGSKAEQNLKEYYTDRFFLGVDGFDTTTGIYTPIVSEAQINRVMGEITREIIVVADSSKFGKRSLAYILPVSKIHTVITDDGLSKEDKTKLISQNIKLIIA